jgi:quinone-modifying oxidoreductase subunit QmoA
MNGNGTRGTILVVGGGISGITAAIEASETGCQVVLVEKEPFLGGRVARAHQYFPKLCSPQCGLEIHLRRLRTSPRIRCLTLTEVRRVTGGRGHYHVTLRRNPRRVTERCTACGACVAACPVERPDAFNLGMRTTKAIYLSHPMAHPPRFVIDGAVCPGPSCGKCVPACPYDAIDLAMQPQIEELEVQAVVWATGWEPYDAARLEGLGFGQYANVVTNVMMERLAALDGPTGGKLARPSDGGPITSIAFVQCAGSRDENHLRHCSGVCCLASLKQARYVRAQYPDATIEIFYIDLRAPGRLEDFLAASQEDPKLRLVKGKVARITEDAATHGLEVEAEDTLSGEPVRRRVDLVVLATGMAPAPRGDVEVEGGLAADASGFLLEEPSPGGMFAVGCARRPTDVATCVRDATGAALKALQCCAGAGR